MQLKFYWLAILTPLEIHTCTVPFWKPQIFGKKWLEPLGASTNFTAIILRVEMAVLKNKLAFDC